MDRVIGGCTKGLLVVTSISCTKEDVLRISGVRTSSGAGMGRERRQGKVFKIKQQRYTLR